MDPETLQEMIHINLVLLHNKGHHIDFKEGMFQERNLPGFEKVSYALALIINQEEVKKSIPWPLLDDKKLRNEFRLKLCKFIKAVNTKHDAKIPELSASKLQYPGGLEFLSFMYRFSTFTIELELQRMMSPEEKGKMFERFDPNKNETDLEVCTNICLGLRYAEEEKMQEHAAYQTEVSYTLSDLEKENKLLEETIKTTQAKLQSSTTDLDIDENMRMQLLDINCNEVMEDWNQRTEVKIQELQRANERLCRVSDLTSSVVAQLNRRSADQGESTCLDGCKLKVPRSIAKFTNIPVRNNRGDLKLEAILNGGLAAVERLTLSSAATEPSLLPRAQELQTETLAQSERVKKCCGALKTLETACNMYITEMRPTWYNSVRDRERPECFSCLRSLPLIPLVLPSGMSKSVHKKDRKSRFSMILKAEVEKKKKKTRNVRTSFKLKGPFLHPLMTPSLHNHKPRACSTVVRATPGQLATSCRSRVSVKRRQCDDSTTYRPSCKKSLYGKLPTGKKPVEDCDSQDKPDDLDRLSQAMISEDFVQNTEQIFTSSQFSRSERKQQQKRRSLDRIIERFRQLKAKQSESITESRED